ncbi:MAG: hypothetical protein QXY90_05640 [Candidatus Anstonellales archaeon]
MGKTASVMRTNPPGVGGGSSDLLPAVARRIPHGVEQSASENSHPWLKGTSFLGKTPLVNDSRGATGESGISLSSPIGDNHKGPFLNM